MAADMDKTCSALCWGIAALLALLLAIALGNAIPVILALILAAAIGLGAAFLLKKFLCGSGHLAVGSAETSEQPDRAERDSAARAAPRQDAAPASAPVEAGKIEIGSTLLEQEQELAARKGTWRYEPEGKRSEAAPAQPEAGEGTRPAALDAPRGGKPDDLKRIKGIGPKLERLCNDMGFYHFDQIAGWSDREIAWVDANLEGFRGRVSRDDWVAQARTLAAGGETEFSSRVDKGDVY